MLLEQVAAVRSRYCKQALKIVRDMGRLAASLHASLLTLDDPASFTVGLRLRLGVLQHSTDKAAMQLVLVQSCCRSNTALVSWLHQQTCAYLDTVLHLNQETLYELARVAAQLTRAVADQEQQASLAGAHGVTNLLVPGSKQV